MNVPFKKLSTSTHTNAGCRTWPVTSQNKRRNTKKREQNFRRNWTERMGRSMTSAEKIKRGKNRQLLLAIYFRLLIFLFIIYCFGLSTDSLDRRLCLKAWSIRDERMVWGIVCRTHWYLVISYGVMHSCDTFIPTPSTFLVDLFLNARRGPMQSIVRNSCKCKFVIIKKTLDKEGSVYRSGLRGPSAYSLLGGGVPTQSIG